MGTITGKDAPAARTPAGATRTLPTWWRERQFAYIPAASFVTGRWSLRKARRDEIKHQQTVKRALASPSEKEA